MQGMAIGALSKASGVKVPTIRFYEQIGLLPAPLRTDSNRRSYGNKDVQRLRFIRHARELGFEVNDIRALLAMTAEPPGARVGPAPAHRWFNGPVRHWSIDPGFGKRSRHGRRVAGGRAERIDRMLP